MEINKDIFNELNSFDDNLDDILVNDLDKKLNHNEYRLIVNLWDELTANLWDELDEDIMNELDDGNN